MIRNPAKFAQWLPALFDGQFHWDFLKPAWQAPMPNGRSSRIEPMDFDAVVERNGHVLIFETKSSGKSIDLGQQITLTDQWKKGASIFHLSGKAPQDIDGIAVYWEGNYRDDRKVGMKAFSDCDATRVIFLSRVWYCRASGWKAPTRSQWDNELWLYDHAQASIRKSA